MAELEPGHPDELRDQLMNWLAQAMSPIGSLPDNTTPAEWVARNFIDVWRKPVRSSLDSIEHMLGEAGLAIQAGENARAISLVDAIRQELAEGVRDRLGLYEWNREEER
jgi:hypothetical protein